MAKDEEAAPAEGGGGGGSKKSIIIIAVVAILVAVGVGAGVAFFLTKGAAGGKGKEAAAHAEEEKKEEHAAAVYMDFKPPFVVNYMVNGRQRYLQLSMSLMARDPEVFKLVGEYLPLIRNNLNMTYSAQDFTMLKRPEGKEAIRSATLKVINDILEKEAKKKDAIEKVLFTGFVMQ
ncbi:MAG TPA: flagellar basal body-associated FliL family protein [Pseudomonadales bacterium]|nr:flagellar basal body-associated FliL family protein [Pseudomonadales bacterium]